MDLRFNSYGLRLEMASLECSGLVATCEFSHDRLCLLVCLGVITGSVEFVENSMAALVQRIKNLLQTSLSLQFFLYLFVVGGHSRGRVAAII